MLSVTKPDRRVLAEPNSCPECQANTDSDRVPVHPNCHCDVETDGIEIPGTDPETMEMIARAVDLPDYLLPDPGSVVSIENLRYGDLLAYEAQNVGQLVTSIVIDTYGFTSGVDLSTILFLCDGNLTAADLAPLRAAMRWAQRKRFAADLQKAMTW